MLLETMARDIILTDRRFGLKLRRHLDKKQASIIRPTHELWKDQANLVTIEMTKKALDAGTLPDEWREAWERQIREYVRDTIITAWIKSIKESGEDISRRVNKIQVKQFDFNTTQTSVKTWVDNQGGTLIVNLTTAQMGSAHALLQHQIGIGVTSPYVLAQRIRPIVGLTNRESLAIVRFMTALTEEGVAANAINSQVAKYAKFLHKNRAARIARTELSNAYNFGNLDSLRQAADGGWLPGMPEKCWIAGGADPCEICQANEAAGYIPLGEAFPSGDQHPTAHPHCECSLGSRVRR